MLTLTPTESRVLGVLIEKAMTTPDQYPLTLNALTNGANQKNNRDPVTTLDENQVLDAVNGLRDKGLLVQVDTAGGRVSKYRHAAQDKLQLGTRDVAILAELLLRGPQTLGELRGRASRMQPLDSLEMAQAVLQQLMTRPEPLVRQLPPFPGTRAERYAQLLCPDLHALDAAPPASPPPAGTTTPSLTQRVEHLEAEVASLKIALERLTASLGGVVDSPPRP